MKYKRGQEVRVVRTSGLEMTWQVVFDTPDDAERVLVGSPPDCYYTKNPSRRLLDAWQEGSMARNTEELDAEQLA